jgi:hypothetical protein
MDGKNKHRKHKNHDPTIPLIKLNKWDKAYAIWKNYSSEPSNSLRSKIEYNLALATEMTGDIDGAIEWAGKSLKSKYSRSTELYLKYLGFRRSKLEEASKNSTGIKAE